VPRAVPRNRFLTACAISGGIFSLRRGLGIVFASAAVRAALLLASVNILLLAMAFLLGAMPALVIVEKLVACGLAGLDKCGTGDFLSRDLGRPWPPEATDPRQIPCAA
jgi:hypothetical protein